MERGVLVERPISCPFRKSYPDVLMVQPGQDWDGDNDTGSLDRPIQGRILAQRQVRARLIGRTVGAHAFGPRTTRTSRLSISTTTSCTATWPATSLSAL